MRLEMLSEYYPISSVKWRRKTRVRWPEQKSW